MNPEEQQFIGPQLPPVQGPQLPTRTITSDQAANNLFTQDAFYRIKDPAGVDNSDVFGVEQPKITPTIDQNLKGTQQFLNQAGFNAGPADGIYGPKTQAGLQGFQTAQNLPVSGQLDQATLQAISNFQMPKMPAPTMETSLDISKLEQGLPSPMQVPQMQDPFQSMITSATARSEQAIKQIQDTLNQQREDVGGFEAKILEVLGQPGEKTLEEQYLKESNVRKYEQDLNEIVGQMSILDAELKQQLNTLEREGSLRSTAGLSNRQRQAIQDVAVQQDILAAKAQILQGNIKLAQDYALRAAQTQAEQRRSQLEQLGLMYDTALRRAEETGNQLATERAQALKFQNDLAIGQLEEGMARYNNAVSIATEAIQRGADPKEVANFMDFARTNPQQAEAEAMARFGQALQTPTEAEALKTKIAEAELQGIRLRNANLGMENKQYEIELSQAVGGNVKLVKNEEEASRLIGEIGNLTNILTSPSMQNAVGVARNRPIFKSESYRDFTNSVDNFIANKTFEELREQKAGGATFGALSDGELGLIADAATTIGRAKQERNGRTTGYAMSEEAFVDEIQTITNYMTVDAIRRGVSPDALGVVVTPDGIFAPDYNDPESLIRLPIEV